MLTAEINTNTNTDPAVHYLQTENQQIHFLKIGRPENGVSFDVARIEDFKTGTDASSDVKYYLITKNHQPIAGIVVEHGATIASFLDIPEPERIEVITISEQGKIGLITQVYGTFNSNIGCTIAVHGKIYAISSEFVLEPIALQGDTDFTQRHAA